MRVAIICKDKPGALQIRLDTRPDHAAYLKTGNMVEMAGPLLDEQDQMCGSLIILKVENMTQAHDWVGSDPYGLAGLFQSVMIKEWNKVIG
ncbi:MAG: YciI family protein [Paracoccaceae bacterium]|jgi:uncharacterized protein|nr:MAG: hypothetical protein ABR99_09110 [Rhodobacter sp. BACL10 MAG-121220-bin24]KRP22443.1 MAG: hypothetical protein ABR97_05745 [Rhodobacter sp. BACL10 MAG-120419-bin15]MDA0354800.1 YciI family protein [Pseudomonadota bacterium]MDO7561152.1 YciI family protein [Paracoccaceae bacterium]HAG27090.1 hypothetical protein [Rhodobacter sp.]